MTREALETHHLVERYWDFSWGVIGFLVARSGTWAVDKANGTRITTWCGLYRAEPEDRTIRIVSLVAGPLRLDVAYRVTSPDDERSA